MIFLPVIIPGLLLLLAIISDYRSRVNQGTINMSYKQFKTYYDIAPEKYDLRNWVCCYYEGTRIGFSDVSSVKKYMKLKEDIEEAEKKLPNQGS